MIPLTNHRNNKANNKMIKYKRLSRRLYFNESDQQIKKKI